MKCRYCQEELKRLAWNTKGDVLTCQTLGCPAYRQPQGFVKVEKRDTMAEVNRKESDKADGYTNLHRKARASAPILDGFD